MTFNEFNSKAENSLYNCIFQTIRQPKKILMLSDKVHRIAEIISLYVKEYEKQAGGKPTIEEILEAINDERF